MKPARGPAALPRLCRVLLAVSVTGLSASREPLCQQESIWLLSSVLERMGNSSDDGMLYTPEDITVCFADNLGCFYMELQVVREEQEEHAATLSRLLARLSQLRRKLRRREGDRGDRAPACPPCLAHPEKPVLAFLERLREMLQWHCGALAAQQQQQQQQQQQAFCPTSAL